MEICGLYSSGPLATSPNLGRVQNLPSYAVHEGAEPDQEPFLSMVPDSPIGVLHDSDADRFKDQTPCHPKLGAAARCWPSRPITRPNRTRDAIARSAIAHWVVLAPVLHFYSERTELLGANVLE